MIPSPSRRALLLGVALAVSLAGTASALADDAVTPPTHATTNVKIDNFTFTPATITIAPGTTVTWQNVDDIPHTVVSIPAKMRSKPLDTNDSFSFTFKEPGEFTYFCSIHPHMVGKVIVK